MDLKHISPYEQFILMAETTHHLSSTMRAFVEFKEVLKVTEQCAKSDTEYITYLDKIISKPVTRVLATTALDNYKKRKWDTTFIMVARCLNIQLK